MIVLHTTSRDSDSPDIRVYSEGIHAIDRIY